MVKVKLDKFHQFCFDNYLLIKFIIPIPLTLVLFRCVNFRWHFLATPDLYLFRIYRDDEFSFLVLHASSFLLFSDFLGNLQ